MTQKRCEICDDPMPLDGVGTICDECQNGIDIEVGLINENESAESEETCETTAPASVEAPSSNETRAETPRSHEPEPSTSKNSVASGADADDPFAGLDLGPSPSTTQPTTPSASDVIDDLADLVLATKTQAPPSEAQPSEAQRGINTAIEEAKATELESAPVKTDPPACEACGFIQKDLKAFKAPTARETLHLCDKCFADEVALVNAKDDPMQGKVVHPDEAEREEILTMDEEDRLLYNEEVLINASTPLDQVYARVELLERRLHRAKLQLKASKRTLTMRVESLDKTKKDEEYRKMGERMAAKKRRQQGDASGTAKKTKTAPTQRKSKAQQFRDTMKDNGFSDQWIDEQIKKMGLE